MAPHAMSPGERQNGNGVANGHNDYMGPPPTVHTEADRPNILYIMADQMSAPILKMHDPESVVKTPNIDALAANGVVFDSAYCNSPLCAPSRFSLVSGQLPSRVGGYDNASHLRSDVPTYAHFLRNEGYETTLAGKMHFIGPDQLHGFENRLTPDIYPGDFGWAVNWDKPDERQEWFHNMSSVLQAGPCARSNQLDFDEEVMYKSTQYLYDYVRQGPGRRPFAMTVSLTHPHDPYAITDDLYDLYEDTEIPLPKVNIKQSQQDPHSERLLKCIDLWGNPIPEEAIKRARRAYYGACTYVDNQIGRLLKTLKDCRLDKNTIIIFSGDHGDMLGERGLWYKMNWFEMSARVPMIIHYPKLFAPRRVKESVSTMDLPPTMLELIGGKLGKHLKLDARSLYPALFGEKLQDEVFGEYMGEGTISPLMMIRTENWKYVISLPDPPQLYDLEADPLELRNVAASEDPKYKAASERFARKAAAKWNLQAIHDMVLDSQRERQTCWSALNKGKFTSWDYQPPAGDYGKYIRSFMPLDDLELRARYPPVDAYGRVKMVAQPHGQAGACGE
ncbi:choline-sulfatase [Aulographum hederae CBS 113979]|uniref:Choline-sulfatase n=1 Tax=Aulographum hederae CBS 113979 TaxID=1176131 RepID=A0A6G1HAQ0_9PEZI|nr:choline-sulfatase [Aulographum hederae CBS 113979]